MHKDLCMTLTSVYSGISWIQTPLPSAVDIMSINEGQLVTHTHRGELCSALKDKDTFLEVWGDFLPYYDPTRSSHDLFRSIVPRGHKLSFIKTMTPTF